MLYKQAKQRVPLLHDINFWLHFWLHLGCLLAPIGLHISIKHPKSIVSKQNKNHTSKQQPKATKREPKCRPKTSLLAALGHPCGHLGPRGTPLGLQLGPGEHFYLKMLSKCNKIASKLSPKQMKKGQHSPLPVGTIVMKSCRQCT